MEDLLGGDGRIAKRVVHGPFPVAVEQGLHEGLAVAVREQEHLLHEGRGRGRRWRERARLVLKLVDLIGRQVLPRPPDLRLHGVALREREQGLGALVLTGGGQLVEARQVEVLVLEGVGQLVGEREPLVGRGRSPALEHQPVRPGVVEPDDLAGPIVDDRLAQVAPGRDNADRGPGPVLSGGQVRREVGLEGCPKLAFDLPPGDRFWDHPSFEPQATDLLNLLSDPGDGRGQARLGRGRWRGKGGRCLAERIGLVGLRAGASGREGDRRDRDRHGSAASHRRRRIATAVTVQMKAPAE